MIPHAPASAVPAGARCGATRSLAACELPRCRHRPVQFARAQWAMPDRCASTAVRPRHPAGLRPKAAAMLLVSGIFMTWKCGRLVCDPCRWPACTTKHRSGDGWAVLRGRLRYDPMFGGDTHAPAIRHLKARRPVMWYRAGPGTCAARTRCSPFFRHPRGDDHRHHQFALTHRLRGGSFPQARRGSLPAAHRQATRALPQRRRGGRHQRGQCDRGDGARSATQYPHRRFKRQPKARRPYSRD